jgi:hypothetical protein
METGVWDLITAAAVRLVEETCTLGTIIAPNIVIQPAIKNLAGLAGLLEVFQAAAAQDLGQVVVAEYHQLAEMDHLV